MVFIMSSMKLILKLAITKFKNEIFKFEFLKFIALLIFPHDKLRNPNDLDPDILSNSNGL